MSTDDKARRLVDQLQTVMEGADGAIARNAAAREALSAQEIKVLSTLGRHEHCIMSKIAERICLSLSGVTGLIDRLVAKKLVARDRSSEDRRVVQVGLTEEGRELHSSVMESQVEFARGALKTLSAAEQDELLALLGKISDRIKSEKKLA
ncbi:MAG TPA: MarR family transcriptional regulator [Elusimicrobiota bacterium]|nr:MarR family transcriptional regulator [Elusimicrobiota bacterium]